MGYSTPIDLEDNERGQLDCERRGMIFKLSRETKIPLPGDVEVIPDVSLASIHINVEYNHPTLIYYPRRALLGKRHNSVCCARQPPKTHARNKYVRYLQLVGRSHARSHEEVQV